MTPQDVERLDQISELLYELVTGRPADRISLDDQPNDELRQVADFANRVADEWGKLADQAHALSVGDIDETIGGRSALAQSLKNLQSVLRHLVWQTQQVAQGDFSQRVDFLGGFSESFNWMVERLEQNREQLLELTRHDALTGLANRRYFDEVLDREAARLSRAGASLALLMLDIDFFKAYNDHYGHQRGDEALKTVAEVLKAHAQRASDLAARYGGEEFALILPATTAAGAIRVAERIRTSVTAAALPHAHSSVASTVTVSIGVAIAEGGGRRFAGPLIAAADAALYRAKESGRNQVQEAPMVVAAGG